MALWKSPALSGGGSGNLRHATEHRHNFWALTRRPASQDLCRWNGSVCAKTVGLGLYEEDLGKLRVDGKINVINFNLEWC